MYNNNNKNEEKEIVLTILEMGVVTVGVVAVSLVVHALASEMKSTYGTELTGASKHTFKRCPV